MYLRSTTRSTTASFASRLFAQLALAMMAARLTFLALLYLVPLDSCSQGRTSLRPSSSVRLGGTVLAAAVVDDAFAANHGLPNH